MKRLTDWIEQAYRKAAPRQSPPVSHEMMTVLWSVVATDARYGEQSAASRQVVRESLHDTTQSWSTDERALLLALLAPEGEETQP